MTGSPHPGRVLRRRNTATAAVAVAAVVGMVGLSYASVPLYRLFCQVTGFGGTTKVADAAPATIGERVIKVRFNAGTAGGLNWSFRPVRKEMTLRVGEQGLATYKAINRDTRTVTGTATFNVTPLKAGAYFSKVECFCFTEQTLEAGQAADMGVAFFIDPDIVDDPNLDDVRTITLSYTFFEAPSSRVQARAFEAPSSRDQARVETGNGTAAGRGVN